MVSAEIKRGIGATIAIVILLSALIGYLPTSHCHCRDSKTPKNQKVQCPFGQLRNLSFSLIAAAALDISAIIHKIPAVEVFTYKKLEGSKPLLAFDAQAPPLFL